MQLQNGGIHINDIFIVNDSKDIDEAVNLLFNYWRHKGFPNYDINNYNKKRELEKLIKYDETNILNGKYIKQTMHSCGFLWTYFPHWVDVKCGNATKTLRENWENDDKLKQLIRKTWNWQLKHGNGKFTINRLRQNAKVYLNKQSVSNFRPTVAKYIYNTFGNDGIVWDMCAGWGGRLFGFLASNCNTYIGTEPSSLTYEGLVALKDDYSYVGKKVQLYKECSEDFIPIKESLDLCFTSPPYFDTEKYSDESTQSFMRYPDLDVWLEKYLQKTIQNCYTGLKQQGKLIINIANTQRYDTLEDETIKMAIGTGFDLVDTYYLILSSIAGKGVKTEPIFIFEKGR